MSEESHQPSPVNPEQHAFNPEHLPEHERGLLRNPEQAHESSKFLIPYLRAGGEAIKRTGNPEAFWGGDERYERELAALKHFYHGKPEAAVAKEAPTAPEGFKHGGKVRETQTSQMARSNKRTKQINSIYDTFKHKLEDKERMVSSLEKALERKPNTKLSKRLSKERGEVERIREHLERVKAHAHAA